MMREIYTKEEIDQLSDCTLCPRECRVNRFSGGKGYCGADAEMNIASICLHRGEEPPISGPDGICNVFFSGCNLRCIYCQNFEISRPRTSSGNYTFKAALDEITSYIEGGIRAVGFVSPSHVIPQVRALIREIRKRGLRPITVYNTNSYDNPEVIKGNEGLIDVYLPDLKYVTASIAGDYSDAVNYPEIALAALREMYYQKGSVLHTDERGRAESGILIRHLVLPGHTEESIKVLKSIAEELSPGVSLSLMSQYFPVPGVKDHSILDRTLHKSEYESVIEIMNSLGFRNGWIQDPDSHLNYRPDFKNTHPFE
jgi:putative pyruvate formate lyase activating enzyme